MLTIRPLFLLAMTVSLFPLAPAQARVAKGQYIHEGLGFRVKAPEGWSEIPVRLDENWIVAKFLSDKTWLSKSKEWNEEHRPLMTIIVFTDDATRFTGWKQTKRGNSTFLKVTELPYQNYRDYLKRNLESGYFYEVENEVEIAGTKVSRFEILRHREESKKRLLTSVWHGEDMSVAIEIEVLEDRIDRLRSPCEEILTSLRFDDGGRLEGKSPSTGDTAAANEDSTLWTQFRDEWKKASIAERTRIRKSMEEQRFRRLREATPASWKVLESRNFLVITHVDDKTTKKYMDAMEAFRLWCDEHFGGLSDDYVRRGVLRICADADEYSAYQFKGSGDSWSSLWDEDREVVTYKDSYTGTSGDGVSHLFSTVLQMYLADVDAYLPIYTPVWLRNGLVSYVTSAWIKGKQIDFRSDSWDKEKLREAERADRLMSFTKLTGLDDAGYYELANSENSTHAQVATLTRFLLGPGAKQKELRTFLHDYMAAVIEVVDEHHEEWNVFSGETVKVAETEEEEEEQAKSKNTSKKYDEQRKKLLEAVNRKVLTFDTKTLDKIERAWQRFAKD